MVFNDGMAEIHADDANVAATTDANVHDAGSKPIATLKRMIVYFSKLLYEQLLNDLRSICKPPKINESASDCQEE